MVASCASFRSISEEKKIALSRAIQQGEFEFEARRAIAQNGFTKTLTSDYRLIVSEDTVRAWLPFYGRAYRAPIDPSEGGIHFISTHFSYHMEERRKTGWEIRIIPQDHKNQVDKMTLQISPSGDATLNVISTYRTPITFYGKITKKK